MLIKMLREEEKENAGGGAPKVTELTELQNRLMKVERELKKTDGVKKSELEEMRKILTDEIGKITTELTDLKTPKPQPPAAAAVRAEITGIADIDDLLGE